MKKILLAVFLLLMSVNAIYSQKKDKTKDQLLDICCHSVTVTVEPTQDCCALIKVNNPLCKSERLIIFEYYDPVTGTYVQKQAEHLSDNTTFHSEFVICPERGEKTITVRVKLAAYPTGLPMCYGLEPVFEEDLSQWTRTLDLSNCCACPPAGTKWLKATVNPDPSCAPGCKVKYELNIPDSVTCFKYYMIEDGAAGVPAQTWDMETHPISMISGCLQPGATSHVTVALMSSLNGAPCVLTDSATCVIDTTVKPKEPKPCLPDCYNSPWDPPQSLKIGLSDCPNCGITVNYVTRKACGYWQDLQITSIEVPNTPACAGCNIESIYKQAVAGVIIFNRMGFEPKYPPNCSTIWRIASGSCWANWKYYVIKLDTTGTGGGSGGGGTSGGGSGGGPIYYLDSVVVWEPCEGAHCCLQPMRVCRLADYTISMNIDTTYQNFFSCDSAWTLNQWGEKVLCQPACDWNANLEGVSTVNFAKEGVEPETKIDEMLGIQTEFTQETLVIRTRSPYAIDAAVTIFDLQGKPLMKRPFKVFAGESTTNVKTDELKTGAYVYSITIGDAQINSGKFVITR